MTASKRDSGVASPAFDRFAAAAVAPYGVWMALMFALPAAGWAYAVRSAATAAMLAAAWLVLRRVKSPGPDCLTSSPDGPSPSPGGQTPSPDGPHPSPGGLISSPDGRTSSPDGRTVFGLSTSLLVGLVVAFVWIWPERFEWYCAYLTIGGGSSASGASPYSPDVCGWPLTIARLVGSAFIIAPAEELFFRSFLYRRLISTDWRTVPPRRFDLSAVVWSVALFALEHDRIVVAAFAGAAYLAVYMRFGLAAAAISHSVTNFALGVYVIVTGSWCFW